MIEFLIAFIIIIAIAFLLIWAVDKLLPEFSYPARIIIGLLAVVAILYRAAPFFP